jgi:hypothetical protein
MTRLDAAFLASVRALAAELRGITDDPDAILDTLDGELDTADVLGELLTLRDEALSRAKAADDRIAAWRDRKTAAARAEDAVRDRIAALMDAIGEKSIRHPLGTVTLRMGKPELIVDDGAEVRLPADLVRLKREVDKVALRKALEDGQQIDCARLGNAAPVLTIRSA